jgi:predicted O-methyltransferase YrrM
MLLCAENNPFVSVMASLQEYIQMSSTIPGWTRNEDAEELARTSFSLGRDAIIVEIGAFLGCCTVLLAGGRCVASSGEVHSVDPFDCSGDAFSVPYYRNIIASLGGGSLRDYFEANIRRAGLSDWVQVHPGRAAEVAATWECPIDLLLLDGDQSPRGAREAFDSWVPFLKPGGIIVLRNTKPREYAEGHDGHRRLVVEQIFPPRFTDVRLVGATTFARKSADYSRHLELGPGV